MSCTHLTKLYQLCHTHGLRISSSDLIRIVCTECGESDACPAALMDINDKEPAEENPQGKAPVTPPLSEIPAAAGSAGAGI